MLYSSALLGPPKPTDAEPKASLRERSIDDSFSLAILSRSPSSGLCDGFGYDEDRYDV